MNGRDPFTNSASEASGREAGKLTDANSLVGMLLARAKAAPAAAGCGSVACDCGGTTSVAMTAPAGLLC